MVEAMAKSRVVVIRGSGVWTPDGGVRPDSVLRMADLGFRLLAGTSNPRAGLESVFKPGQTIGIKVNTIGGKALSTRPEVSLSLARWLSVNGIDERNLVIWDRTSRELRGAGYTVSSSPNGLRILGTDAPGAGYGKELVSHREVGSLFSTIQTDVVSASISLAILKDHGLAGITAGMKNYFGAIHNPNKYHDTHCDPYVADVFDCPAVKRKHRLTIIDALLVQYHRGPSYHPRWAKKHGALMFSFDPVAADRVGWDLVETLRAEDGLPSLEEEGRAPRYLATAEKLGLGRMDPADIEIVVEEA